MFHCTCITVSDCNSGGARLGNKIILAVYAECYGVHAKTHEYVARVMQHPNAYEVHCYMIQHCELKFIHCPPSICMRKYNILIGSFGLQLSALLFPRKQTNWDCIVYRMLTHCVANLEHMNLVLPCYTYVLACVKSKNYQPVIKIRKIILKMC